ncbi:hypothetical protein EBS80_04305 [bacterium]|nr:hypothetical protein [bacterium]
MPFNIPAIAIPLWALLVVYGAFLAFFLLYALFNLYHLLRFGTYGAGLYTVICVFTAGTVGILIATYALLSPIDWTVTIPLSSVFQGASSVPYFPAQ